MFRDPSAAEQTQQIRFRPIEERLEAAGEYYVHQLAGFGVNSRKEEDRETKIPHSAERTPHYLGRCVGTQS